MDQFNRDYPEYLESETDRALKKAQQVYKVRIDNLKKRFNQTGGKFISNVLCYRVAEYRGKNQINTEYKYTHTSPSLPVWVFPSMQWWDLEVCLAISLDVLTSTDNLPAAKERIESGPEWLPTLGGQMYKYTCCHNNRFWLVETPSANEAYGIKFILSLQKSVLVVKHVWLSKIKWWNYPKNVYLFVVVWLDQQASPISAPLCHWLRLCSESHTNVLFRLSMYVVRLHCIVCGFCVHDKMPGCILDKQEFLSMRRDWVYVNEEHAMRRPISRNSTHAPRMHCRAAVHCGCTER